MKKRFLSVLLALVLTVGMMPITGIMTRATVSSAPEGAWSDYAASNFGGGDGSESEPYKIATAAELALLAVKANSTLADNGVNGKYFILMQDIDLSAHRWVPICTGNDTGSRSFGTAHFDGNNKTITGLYVEEKDGSYAGFFGDLQIATIKNLTIKDAVIKATGKAGILAGNVSKSYNSAAPQIENCHVSGTVEGVGYVGGMIGNANYAGIKNCTSNCNVTGQWTVGGFIGCIFAGSIEKCESTADISCSDWNNGGFIGYNDGSTIKNSIARGTLDNTMTGNINPPKSGGFVGTNATGAVISNCHTTVKVTVASKIGNPGGFIGYAGPGEPNEGYVDYGTTQNCSFNAENYDNATAIGYVDGDNSGENNITAADTYTVLTNICKDYYGNTEHKYGTDKVCTDCGYKLVYWTDEGNYDISWYVGHESDNSYEIADAADLAGLAVLVNGLNGQTAVDFSCSISPNIPVKFSKTITIKNDIDLSGKLWTPIGTNENSFMGTFDGNGKTVTNMTVVASKSFAGLFGCVGDSNTSTGLQIYNLKVISSSVTATGDSANYIAGIVGYMVNGTLRNCSYSGTVSAEGQFVAGVIAQPENSNVTNCVNYATVTATGTEARQVGGVVGDSMGYISNCANFGNVTGYLSVGGIAGKVSLKSLENCYNVGNIIATATSEIAGAIVGYVLPPTYGVSSIANCYFLEGTATEALGSAKVEFKTTMYSVSKTDFTSGKVAYSLNGKDGGTNFYQNLDNGKTVDEYPLPDSAHGKVYHFTVYAQCDKGDTNPIVKYSNSSKNDEVPAHIYQYSASGNIIIETCKNCEIHEETAVLVISSENELVYSGQAHTPVSVHYSDGWQGGTLTVNYENNINAGTNTASAYIEVGDKKAEFKFSIAKAGNEWLTEPTISGWTFGGTAATPNSKAKFGEVKVTYSGTANDESKYESSENAPQNAGIYKATFTVEGTNNYTKLEKSIDFVISKANRIPSVTPITGVNETVDGKADGKITGVNNLMEYRKDGDKTYVPVTASQIENLEDGKYFVRYGETHNYNASDDYEVVIGKGKKLTVTVPETQTGYTVSVNKTELVWNDSVEITFTLSKGYSKLSSFAVSVTANGNTVKIGESGKCTLTDIKTDVSVEVVGVGDITPPTAEIKLGENNWNKFFNSITFGLFFKKTQTVTITAADEGSGVDKIYYYLSATELTETQVKELSSDKWTAYTDKFNINPNNEYIIYAKLTDKDGNAAYINSNGIVLDDVAPVISGIANGETHYGDTAFTVTDKHIEEVKVDGNPLTLTADGKYTIKADGKEHTVSAMDKSGNASAEIKITVITIASLDDTIESITKDNVKSSDREKIESVQTLVKSLINGDKTFTETETANLNSMKANTEALLNKISDVSDEMSNLDSSVKAYDINKVKSDDKTAIGGLITRIDVLLNGNNLTENEKVAMTALKTTAQGLVKRIDDTASKVADLTGKVNAYDKDKVKSTDKDTINGLIEEMTALINGNNLNDTEKETLDNVKTTAENLIKKIDDTADEIKAITDGVNAYDKESVKSTDKEDIKNLIKRIDVLAATENITDEEKSDLEALKATAQDLLDKIDEIKGMMSSLTESVNGYDINKVKSDDKKALTGILATIDQLLEGDNLTDTEKEEMTALKEKTENLLKKIEDAAAASKTDNTEKVKDITSDNVETKDKSDLEKAKDDLEKALEDYKDNLTDDEKKEIGDEIDRIEKALEVIDNVEKVEDVINKLPDTVKKSDADAIKKADDAYNALSKYEQSVLDKNAKEKLDNAKSALDALNKPTDSPSTGDSINLRLWVALALLSVIGLLGATVYVYRSKRKETEN